MTDTISPVMGEEQKTALVASLRARQPSYTLPYVFLEHGGEMVACRIPTVEQARAFASGGTTPECAIAIFKATVAHPEGEQHRKLMRAKPLLAVTFGLHLARHAHVAGVSSRPLAGEALEALLVKLRQTPDDVLYVLEAEGEQAVCRSPTEGEVLHWASQTSAEAVRAEQLFDQCVLHPDGATRERIRLHKPFACMAFGLLLLQKAGMAIGAENFELRSS